MSVRMGEVAPEVIFGGPEGDIALSDLYREGPVVVAFLRHFG